MTSRSGRAPVVNKTRSAFRGYAQNMASGFQLYDFAAWCAVNFLYLVEFADWNGQSKIGQGIVNDSAAHNTGETDAMTYHTGRAAGTDGLTAVQYRWIENPWGNVFKWIDGININNRVPYVCTDPSKYADDTTTGYTSIGVTLPSNGWTKSLGLSEAAPWAYAPDGVGGSATTYIPDYLYSGTGWRVLRVGGNWLNGSSVGLFYFVGGGTSSHASSNLGARLQFRDPTATQTNEEVSE